MMTGIVDHSGRALVEIELGQALAPNAALVIPAWVDTGFTGELVLPQSMISQIGLVQSGSVSAVLADGSQVTLETFSCVVRWFGEVRSLEVVCNDGDHALLGVGLLLDHILHIDYQTVTLSIE